MRKLLMREWTDAEIETLIKMLGEHRPVWRMAQRLRRSQSAVRAKLVKLDLRLSPETHTLRDMRRLVFKASAPTANP